jgi:hypothetical protein
MAALSLSKQQWRTYRQALSPLAAETGRSACFSAGDLLATAIVQSAAATLQMPIPAFASVADTLFNVCGAHPWAKLERVSLVLLPSEARVLLLDYDQRLPICSLAVLVELGPIVGDLRERLLAAGGDPQHDLAFPPMVAGGRS